MKRIVGSCIVAGSQVMSNLFLGSFKPHGESQHPGVVVLVQVSVLLLHLVQCLSLIGSLLPQTLKLIALTAQLLLALIQPLTEERRLSESRSKPLESWLATRSKSRCLNSEEPAHQLKYSAYKTGTTLFLLPRT